MKKLNCAIAILFIAALGGSFVAAAHEAYVPNGWKMQRASDDIEKRRVTFVNAEKNLSAEIKAIGDGENTDAIDVQVLSANMAKEKGCTVGANDADLGFGYKCPNATDVYFTRDGDSIAMLSIKCPDGNCKEGVNFLRWMKTNDYSELGGK